MRQGNDDRHDYRERQQDFTLGRRRISVRTQQTLYRTAEELHAALRGDATHLCLAISAVRGVLCHSLPITAGRCKRLFAGAFTSGYLIDGRAA